jgi:hypothetical protein
MLNNNNPIQLNSLNNNNNNTSNNNNNNNNNNKYTTVVDNGKKINTIYQDVAQRVKQWSGVAKRMTV